MYKNLITGQTANTREEMNAIRGLIDANSVIPPEQKDWVYIPNA